MTWIGGIEALHSFTPPGASEPAITLGQGAYRITGIQGLSSLGESEANSDARVGGVGEVARLSQRRGRTVVYEGRIIASSLLELRDAEFELREAFDDDSGEGRVEIAAHPDNAELADEMPKYYEARALSCDISDQQTTKGFTRSFVIGLRMGTPRIYDVEETSHELAIAKTKTANSMALILPRRYLGPILALSLPKYAVAVNLVITNVTTGKTMTIEVPALAAALEVTLDFAAKTVIDSKGVNRSAWVSAADDALWVSNPLIEGSNDVRVEAFEALDGTAQTVAGVPATLVDAAGVGTVAWSNPEKAAAVGGGSALAALGGAGASHYLEATNLALPIPAGSPPLGIQVEGKVGTNFLSENPARGVFDNQIRLIVGGVVKATVDKATTGKWGAEGEGWRKWGGAADLWGLALTQAECVASNFGVAISARSTTEGSGTEAFVDALKISATYRYTPAAVAYAVAVDISWRRSYA